MPTNPAATNEVSAEIRAAELHQEALVFDAVNRAVIDERFFGNVRTGNIAVLGRTILVSDPHVFSPFGFEESLREIAELHELAALHKDKMLIVQTVDDIELARSTGRVGIYVYFQSPEPLARYPWRLRLFYELGLRILQMTYNDRELTGDGCAEANDAGLSNYGRTLIKQCNELGIAVDASHCGDRTTMETIEASETPVLLTHGNSRVICPKPRCKTDEQVKACASRGGVIGVQAFPPFINDGSRPPTIEDVLDHVDHYADLVGTEHIGLGLDLVTGHETDDFQLLGYDPQMYEGAWVDGVQQTVEGLSHLGELPQLTEGMLKRGYDDADIKNILGANYVRVLRQIWK
jgi:membrane dipeptidase